MCVGDTWEWSSVAKKKSREKREDSMTCEQRRVEKYV